MCFTQKPAVVHLESVDFCVVQSQDIPTVLLSDSSDHILQRRSDKHIPERITTDGQQLGHFQKPDWLLELAGQHSSDPGVLCHSVASVWPRRRLFRQQALLPAHCQWFRVGRTPCNQCADWIWKLPRMAQHRRIPLAVVPQLAVPGLLQRLYRRSDVSRHCLCDGAQRVVGGVWRSGEGQRRCERFVYELVRNLGAAAEQGD